VDTLDILAEVIARYPAQVANLHTQILEVVLPTLLYPRPLARKRAVIALGTTNRGTFRRFSVRLTVGVHPFASALSQASW